MELSKIVETNREKSLAMGKLEYWRENINDIFNDRPLILDPVAHCLHHACAKNHLSKGLFLKLLDSKVNKKVGFDYFGKLKRSSGCLV